MQVFSFKVRPHRFQFYHKRTNVKRHGISLPAGRAYRMPLEKFNLFSVCPNLFLQYISLRFAAKNVV